MNIITSLLDKEEELHYDDFLCKNSANLFYSSLPYKRLLEKHLVIDCFYLIAKIENNIVGAFPFVIYKNENFGNVANSLPYYGSNGGIILLDTLPINKKEEISRILLKEALAIIELNKCVAYTFISNPLQDDVRIWMENHVPHDFIDSRIGQITPLPNFDNGLNLAERLMKVFDNPRPRNIRKAIKSNVKVRFEYSQEAMHFLYQTHKENIESIGGIPKKSSFFEQVLEVVDKPYFKVYIAEIDDKPVASLLLFYFNKTVEYFTPATIHEFRELQPSSLLIFEAMKDAISEGYTYWNWGGTWKSQNGVYDFKKKWGANDLPYYYYTKIIESSILKLDKDILLSEYPHFFVFPFQQIKN